jgi:hypothetical protein
VPKAPLDDAIPLDGTVGALTDAGATAPLASLEQPSFRAFVSGDAAADTRAMGLAEDLSMLIQKFLQGSAASAREKASAAPGSGQLGDIEIALHGLQLDPDQEAHLHQLIRELVHERVADKTVSK